MSAAPAPSSKGVLYPDKLPATFRRIPANESLQDLVRWWWIATWNLEEGEKSEQSIIAFPASNLAVENAYVGFAGPTTRASKRELTGTGWVIGALLQPAAAFLLYPDLSATLNSYIHLQEPEIHRRVTIAVKTALSEGIPILANWLAESCGPLTEEDLFANRMVQAAESNPTIHTVYDLARHMNCSERTLHRLCARYVGLTPYAIIRRFRIQNVAEEIRCHPYESIADIAARCGFSDHAHCARELRVILGMSPSTYRKECAPRPRE